jgi:hypothetical protein
MFFNNSYLILNVNRLEDSNFLKNEYGIVKDNSNFCISKKYKNIKNNNLFFIKNKYNFYKLEFGFFNSAKEERINQKFLKTLIERSVDLFLIKKINSFYFILNKNSLRKVLGNNKQLLFSVENNHLDIKKFYFKTFVSKLKKLLLSITKHDLENLNYFTKKKILNFCIYDNKILKKENLTIQIFRFSFSLVFQKLYLDFIIFNYSKFFFLDITRFFNKKSLFFILNKKLIVSRSLLSFNKRYFLLYLYNNKKSATFTINKEKKNLGLFNFRNFYQLYNNFDIINKIQNFHLFVNLKQNKINFYFEQKINNFYFKIGILNNINFFFSFNNFFRINVFLKFFNFESFNKNIYFSNNKDLIIKIKNIYYNFSKYNFLKKCPLNNFDKNKIIFKKLHKNYFYFFTCNNMKSILTFNENFTFLIFNIYEFFYDIKIEKINFFFLRLLNFYYFLQRNRNLFLEHLDSKKMDQRTYYKKYFLKERYKDLFSTFLKASFFIRKKKYLKKELKYKFFNNFRFFSDIFFKKIFNINIFFHTMFSKKIDVTYYVRKFFKNFIYFLFLNSRNIYNEYKFIFLNLLSYLQTNKINNFFLEKFDFFSFDDKKIFNKHKFLIKKVFSYSFSLKQTNFLSFLLKNFFKKIFLKKFFNKKLNFYKSYINFFINIQKKFLNILKYKQIVNFFNKKTLFKSKNYTYYQIKNVFLFLKNILKQKNLNFFYNNIFIKINYNVVENLFIFNKTFNFLNMKRLYFNTYNTLQINYKIQYYFFKNNKNLLNYLNKFLNITLLNTKNVVYENRLSNIFCNNFLSNFLHLFINNNIFVKNINFQNFEFLWNFENFNKKVFNLDIVSSKKTKVYFKFLKNLIFLYLNTIFCKKQYFLIKTIFFNSKNNIVSNKNKKNFICKSKILSIYNKLSLNLLSIKKKNLFLNTNYYLKFLYFKVFFYKFFFFPYSKIISNFLKFLKNVFIKPIKQDFFNFHSLNLKFYSFFFKFLTKKNKNKQNLLWLKINITKRNVFANLFLNRKKPSVFVFTAGQTSFEGKLKKSKQAGMLIGRKLWKHIVILSKKNFFYNELFFLNFKKIFNTKSNKKLNNNYEDEINSFLKKYSINLKKNLAKIIIKKNKIIKLLNKYKILLYNKTKIIKCFVKQNGIKNFYKVKYFNQKKNNNSFNYSNNSNIKLYYTFFQYRKFLFFFPTIYLKVFESLKFCFTKKKILIFNSHMFKTSFAKILKKKMLIKSNFPSKIIKIKYNLDEDKSLIFLHNLYNSYKKIAFIIFNPLKKIVLFFNFINNKIKKTSHLKLKKKIIQNFFFLLTVKLKKFIFIKFFLMRDIFFLNKIKSIFLIKRKRKLFKKLTFNIYSLIIFKKKIKFDNLFHLMKKIKYNNVNFNNRFLKVKNFEFKSFLNLINNKKLNKIYRIKYFLIINIRKKFNENLNKLTVFLKNINFFYHFKFLYIYKNNNFFYKTIVKFKNFFIKFKLYNYFLFFSLKNNNKFCNKKKMLKKIYLKIKNLSIFSCYIDSLFKKINYFWKKKLFPKIFSNVKIGSQKKNFDYIKFIFLYFRKLKFIFKFLITSSNLMLNNFKRILKYKKKNFYFRVRNFYEIFFDYLKDAYFLVNSLIYSNLLYKFLMFDKNRKNKNYSVFFTLFKRLKYILLNLLKKNFLDLKKYTNLYKIIPYKRNLKKRSLLFNKRYLLDSQRSKIRKKKKTKALNIYNKYFNYINLLKKDKYKVVKLYKKKLLTFYYWKFFKIQIYKKNFKYSLFFNIRFNYFNIIKKYFSKANSFIIVYLNLSSEQKRKKHQFFYKSFYIFNFFFLLRKGKIKNKLLKRKTNFKDQKFDRYRIFKQKELSWLKNLKKKKKLFYKKIMKRRGFLFRNFKTLSFLKINNFLNNYFFSNFFFFKFFKHNIKILKKIFFFKKILQIYFVFYKIIKKYKNNKKKIIKYRKYKFFIKYFIKLFLKPFVLLRNKRFKIYLSTSLKRIVLNFFITKKKLLFYFFFNPLIRNISYNNIKIINFKFFDILNYILTKKTKKKKNYFNNNLNIFYLKINSLLFKNFFNKIEIKKNYYFYLNKKAKLLSIITNFNKILKIKNERFVSNNYKILINCKNFINYKKFFLNNFFFFFKYNIKKVLKKIFFKPKNKKIMVFAKKMFLENSYDKITTLSFINQKILYLTNKSYLKIKLKYNILFYIFKFYRYFISKYNNIKRFLVTTFFKNFVIANKKIKSILNLKKEKNQKLKNLKRINLFLNINNIKSKINFNKFIINSNLSRVLNINISGINRFIEKNKFIKKKFLKANKLKLKTFSLNFLTSMVFFYKFKNIIFPNIYLLTNKITLLNFFSLKKFNKNVFKRWRKKYYSNFDNKFFVPKKGFLLILSQKRNRVIRGILKGFVQQARGKKLLKRLKPQFVKIKKFVFTRSRKVKGKRK